jgi:hypothetical protein
MRCCSRDFNEREGEFDVRGAAEATAAARGRHVEARGGRSRRVFNKQMEIHMPKIGPTGTGAHRDIVTR